MNNKELGLEKESAACRYLEEQGYKIIERNWRWSNRGEIDIIALDPSRFNREYLIFVEVKYRNYSMEMSLGTVNHKKIEQIKNQNISFDFIAISGKEIKHLKNIVS